MLNKEKLFVLALKELVFCLTYRLRQKYSLDIKQTFWLCISVGILTLSTLDMLFFVCK